MGMDELDELIEATNFIMKQEVINQSVPTNLLNHQIPIKKSNNPFPTPDYSKKTSYNPTTQYQQQGHKCPHCGGEIEQQYTKGVVNFKGIITVTLYPNGKMATYISKPLGADQRFDPKQKKKVNKPTIQFERQEKTQEVDLG